jgi:galactose mutarotase-like enzyme
MRMEMLTLRAGDLEATFVPHANMVGASLRHRGEELLFQREGLEGYVQRGKVFGIPLLHPWANRLGGFAYEAAGRRAELDPGSPLVHTEEHGLPIHGLLAGCPYWEVLEAGDTAIRARLDFGAHDDLLAAFPFPHQLDLEVALDPAGLRIATTLTPSGETAVPVAFGFHPYLRLPGVPRAEWLVDLPVTRRLLLDERALPTGEAEPVAFALEPLGERTFDDPFDGLEPGRPFVLAGGGRTIEVSFEHGYPLAQVFAPPEQETVCFEPMTAPANALRSHDRLPLAQPGEPFAAAFRIGIGAR